MKHLLLKKRNEIYYQVWQENKNFLTMKDCAEVFNCDVKNYYKILKKEEYKGRIKHTKHSKQL